MGKNQLLLRYFFFFLIIAVDFVAFYHFSHFFSQSDKVQIGASLNILENLREITIGQATFILPDNIQELEDILGEVGGCVPVGYSFIETLQDQGSKRKKKKKKKKMTSKFCSKKNM